MLAGSSAGGWFRPIAESNALFLTRAMWDALGGYDEAFAQPGGGLANLDAYVRACALDGSQLIMLLGEGTFHQMHGGVSTGAARPRWPEFHDEYVRLRGRAYEKPANVPWLFGTLRRPALPFVKQSLEGLVLPM